MIEEADGSTCDHTLYRLMRPWSRDGQFEAFKVCARAVWASTSVAQLRAVLSMYELSTYNSRSGRYEADMPKSLFPQLIIRVARPNGDFARYFKGVAAWKSNLRSHHTD